MSAPAGQKSSDEPDEGDEPDKHRAARTRPGRTEHLVCSTKMRPLSTPTKPDEPDEWSLGMAPDDRKHRLVREKRQVFLLRAASPTQNLYFGFLPAPGLSQARPGPGISANKNKSSRAGKMTYSFHHMLFCLGKTSIYVWQFSVRPPAEPGTSTVKLGQTRIKCISPM